MGTPQTPPLMAFVAMALGATGLTLGDFFIKQASMDGVTIASLLLFSWPLTVVGITVLAHFSGGIRHHLYPHNPGKLAVRAVLLLIMAWLNITSLSLNPYSQHAMLFQLSPVFAMLLGVYFLSEKMTLHVGLVFVACLVGAWMIVSPGAAGFSAFLIIAVLAALSNAVTNLYIAANRDAATALGFTFYAVNSVALVVAVYWLAFERVIPDPGAQIWIQLSAVFAVAGIIFVGLAMQMARGNIGRVSIMLYVQIPVALFLGWLVFGENPTTLDILGGILIAVSGASIPLVGRRRLSALGSGQINPPQVLTKVPSSTNAITKSQDRGGKTRL